MKSCMEKELFTGKWSLFFLTMLQSRKNEFCRWQWHLLFIQNHHKFTWSLLLYYDWFSKQSPWSKLVFVFKWEMNLIILKMARQIMKNKMLALRLLPKTWSNHNLLLSASISVVGIKLSFINSSSFSNDWITNN